MDNNGQKQLSLPLTFQQFPRILILSITSRIVVDLHGKFIQNAKGINPKPMAVEGDEKKKPFPSTTCTLSGSRPYTILTH